MKKIQLLIVLGSLMFSHAASAQWTVSGNSITNTNNSHQLYIRQTASNPALVPAHGNWALFSFGSTTHSSGTASKLWGAYLLSLNEGTGTLNESIGANVTTGNINNGSGVVNTAVGLFCQVQAGLGTVHTGYGVYIKTVDANNSYGLYQANSVNKNYFAGNVGIGTTLVNNPNGYKLAVNGKIGAKEVQVENTSSSWADYVFEPDYELMPLNDLAAFVKSNKHLPEIPSKAEVEEHGHKLGEMDVLLLKKVEELTLYVIQLQEENKNQQAEIQKLKAERH